MSDDILIEKDPTESINERIYFGHMVGKLKERSRSPIIVCVHVQDVQDIQDIQDVQDCLSKRAFPLQSSRPWGRRWKWRTIWPKRQP